MTNLSVLGSLLDAVSTTLPSAPPTTGALPFSVALQQSQQAQLSGQAVKQDAPAQTDTASASNAPNENVAANRTRDDKATSAKPSASTDASKPVDAASEHRPCAQGACEKQVGKQTHEKPAETTGKPTAAAQNADKSQATPGTGLAQTQPLQIDPAMAALLQGQLAAAQGRPANAVAQPEGGPGSPATNSAMTAFAPLTGSDGLNAAQNALQAAGLPGSDGLNAAAQNAFQAAGLPGSGDSNAAQTALLAAGLPGNIGTPPATALSSEAVQGAAPQDAGQITALVASLAAQPTATADSGALSTPLIQALVSNGMAVGAPASSYGGSGNSLNSLTPAVGTPDWQAALGQKITVMTGSGQHTAELTLNPPDLGPLRVVIEVADKQANAMFVAHHALTRDAIEAAVPALREAMASSSIALGNVSVSQGFAQQNGQSGNGYQSAGNTAKSTRYGVNGTSKADSIAASPTSARPLSLIDTFV